MLEKVTKKDINTTNIKFWKKISYADAAVLADRADALQNGSKVSNSLKTKMANIKKYKRISDLSKVPTVKQGEVVSCFAKGIFTGKSNGTYSQSDRMGMNLYLTKEQADAIVKRVTNKKNRKKITEDGQVIRTTNLPKNAKKFPYVLESIPNSFYDSYFNWEGRIKLLDKNIERRYPKDVTKGTMILWDEKVPVKEKIDKYRYEWAEKVKKNVRGTILLHGVTDVLGADDLVGNGAVGKVCAAAHEGIGEVCALKDRGAAERLVNLDGCLCLAHGVDVEGALGIAAPLGGIENWLERYEHWILLGRAALRSQV